MDTSCAGKYIEIYTNALNYSSHDAFRRVNRKCSVATRGHGPREHAKKCYVRDGVNKTTRSGSVIDYSQITVLVGVCVFIFLHMLPWKRRQLRS